jgi:L-fuconolactonase
MQESVVESLELLAAVGLVFDAFPVNAAQFESATDVARLLPQLKIVINHLARPPIPKQGWEPWATQIARAAEHRNDQVYSTYLALSGSWRQATGL